MTNSGSTDGVETSDEYRRFDETATAVEVGRVEVGPDRRVPLVVGGCIAVLCLLGGLAVLRSRSNGEAATEVAASEAARQAQGPSTTDPPTADTPTTRAPATQAPTTRTGDGGTGPLGGSAQPNVDEIDPALPLLIPTVIPDGFELSQFDVGTVPDGAEVATSERYLAHRGADGIVDAAIAVGAVDRFSTELLPDGGRDSETIELPDGRLTIAPARLGEVTGLAVTEREGCGAFLISNVGPVSREAIIATATAIDCSTPTLLTAIAGFELLGPRDVGGGSTYGVVLTDMASEVNLLLRVTATTPDGRAIEQLFVERVRGGEPTTAPLVEGRPVSITRGVPGGPVAGSMVAQWEHSERVDIQLAGFGPGLDALDDTTIAAVIAGLAEATPQELQTFVESTR